MGSTSDLGALMKAGGNLGSDPQALVKSILGELGDLAKLLDIPAAAAVSEVAASFDQLTGFVREILDQLGGDPATLIDRLLGEAGGLEKFTRDIMKRALDAIPVSLPGELTSGFEAIASIAKSSTVDARTLASTLSRVVLGFDLADLQAPTLHIGSVVARVARAGGNIGPVRVAMDDLAFRVRAVSEMLLEPEPDVDAIVATLGAIKGRLDLFINSTLAGAIARLTIDLAALNPTAIAARLRVLLVPFETRLSGALFDIEQELVGPLRNLAAMIAALTPEDLTARFDAFAERLKGNFAESGLDTLLESIDDVFEMIVGEIRRVPVRRLRLDLLKALASVESRIRTFPEFSAPKALIDQIQSIEAAIDKVDTASIQQKVDGFAATLNRTLDAFPIGAIKTELEGVIDAVRDALGQITPALHDLEAQLAGLAGQVQGLDFSRAGQASVVLMRGVRANVEKAVGSGDLPEPARAAIGVAAGALKGLNVTVEISKPFDEALANLDASAVLAPIGPVMGRLRALVHDVTPQALGDRARDALPVGGVLGGGPAGSCAVRRVALTDPGGGLVSQDRGDVRRCVGGGATLLLGRENITDPDDAAGVVNIPRPLLDRLINAACYAH